MEAIDLINSEMAGVSLQAFESDKRKRCVVERGIKIISEASRHLTADLKQRRPEIPWPKVAGIGNILRHDYERIALLYYVVKNDPPVPYELCRTELAASED